MKLCFSTLGCVEKSLDEIVALAKRFSIEGLEIRGMSGKVANAEIDEINEKNATKTKEYLKGSGLCPIVLGTSCAFHTKEKYEKAMKEGAVSIAIAKSLGIPYIRVFGNNITENREECIAQVSRGISELCTLARGEGVEVLLEVHGDYNTAEALGDVIGRLEGRDNFGLIWDIAHSHRVYGNGWLPFYESIKPYIRHVHIKDLCDSTGALTLVGKGDIPIIPIAEKLIADGYDGYFSLEWERQWHPELDDIETALEHFVSHLSPLIKK